MLLPSEPAPSAHVPTPIPAAPFGGGRVPSPALLAAASCLTQHLAEGRALLPDLIRAAMTDACGGTDADGCWTWREAYDACEVAQVLSLRRHGPPMLARAGGNAGTVVTMLERLARLAPSQTKRTEGSVALQQFSTPLPLGYVASLAAGIRPDDVVLEPSAGAGMLAVFAEIAGAALALNELAPARVELLASLFPIASVTRHDAEAIDDRLDASVRPSVILMNPPFSASPHVDERRAEATWGDVSSAFCRLRTGGRLVAITASWFAPEDPAWSSAFERLAERGGRLLLTVPIHGHVFARHGTTVATRLTVIDKVAGSSGDLRLASLPEAGGVAGLEVLARDLKSLGLFVARSLSFHGIEYEIVEHPLTPEQTRIYDLYAAAFQVIHANLEAALEATNITGEGGCALNRQAKSAARSAFESNKQRFIGHLLIGMKCPTLIAAVARDLAEGSAPVIQLVSTGEALLERHLAQIPPAEWGDVQVDVTPREYVLDYLQHSWPTQLFEVYADEGGDLRSRPALDEGGQLVVSREAVALRDRTIERLAALPPVQSALDQIVQHFGTGVVAEVTGRSRRIVRKPGDDGHDVLAVERRPASSNLSETEAFMDGAKQVLVFSDAGGTGRSYHADLGAKNQRRRVHYLLEPGWRADNAVQGLGRTNRTDKASPPLFRPVTTDVKGERRFISTIARRLDALGAITHGQRQTGGQNLFRPEDNLESDYARIALRQFYGALYRGRVEGCSLEALETATGLDLTDRDGTLREELPPIQRFLNRLLALPIALQNRLFGVFETHLTALLESAKAGGTYDLGVETITADQLTVTESRIVYTHPKTGAETRLLRVVQRERQRPMSLDELRPKPRESDPVPRNSSLAARRLFAMGVPVPGTLAERYLRSRGITAALDLDALRYHPAVFCRELGLDRALPALLAGVTDLSGRIVAVQRTWLDPVRTVKARLRDPRRSLGDQLGHGVRLGRARDVLLVGEGLETVLSIRSVCPTMPMVAGLSANHLGALELPPGLRRLYIARDRDRDGFGAAKRLRRRATSQGVDVVDLVPQGGDFNVDLQRFGVSVCRARILRMLVPEDTERYHG